LHADNSIYSCGTFYSIYSVNTKRNVKGETMQLILRSTCADHTMTYDPISDDCH